MSQTLSPRTKILLALAALLLLAGGHFAVRQWRAGQQPAAETVVQTDCDPNKAAPCPTAAASALPPRATAPSTSRWKTYRPKCSRPK